MRVVVTGASGFLGGALCETLAKSHEVTAVGRRPFDQWWRRGNGVPIRADLMDYEQCLAVVTSADWVFHMACNFGGRSFVDSAHSACAANAAMDLNMLRACAAAGVKRFFFASSACVYPTFNMEQGRSVPLAEWMVGPPYQPDGIYGHAKLFTEMACAAFARDFGLEVRIGRLHTTFGAYADWTGGREKVPSAMLRKMARYITRREHIEIWGTGEQRRTFLHVDEAVEAIIRIMESDYDRPLNVGSEEVVSINELAAKCAKAMQVDGAIMYRVDGPEGPHSRSCDNTLVRRVLGWAPSATLQEGLHKTAPWVLAQVLEELEREAVG